MRKAFNTILNVIAVIALLTAGAGVMGFHFTKGALYAIDACVSRGE